MEGVVVRTTVRAEEGGEVVCSGGVDCCGEVLRAAVEERRVSKVKRREKGEGRHTSRLGREWRGRY
jgi:hypothetical protein